MIRWEGVSGGEAATPPDTLQSRRIPRVKERVRVLERGESW